MLKIGSRFRRYYPVVVDVETGGFNPSTDALLEISAVTLQVKKEGWSIAKSLTRYIEPFEGANLDPNSLKFTGIDPTHPFRQQITIDEKTALNDIFQLIHLGMAENHCQRAILVGHNAAFDLSFINAAIARCNIKKNPFHKFSTFDTVSLAGLLYGQTVLAEAMQAAGLDWDNQRAHSAQYDAEQTARLFCTIVNTWEASKNK